MANNSAWLTVLKLSNLMDVSFALLGPQNIAPTPSSVLEPSVNHIWPCLHPPLIFYSALVALDALLSPSCKVALPLLEFWSCSSFFRASSLSFKSLDNFSFHLFNSPMQFSLYADLIATFLIVRDYQKVATSSRDLKATVGVLLLTVHMLLRKRAWGLSSWFLVVIFSVFFH